MLVPSPTLYTVDILFMSVVSFLFLFAFSLTYEWPLILKYILGPLAFFILWISSLIFCFFAIFVIEICENSLYINNINNLYRMDCKYFFPFLHLCFIMFQAPFTVKHFLKFFWNHVYIVSLCGFGSCFREVFIDIKAIKTIFIDYS